MSHFFDNWLIKMLLEAIEIFDWLQRFGWWLFESIASLVTEHSVRLFKELRAGYLLLVICSAIYYTLEL